MRRLTHLPTEQLEVDPPRLSALTSPGSFSKTSGKSDFKSRGLAVDENGRNLFVIKTSKKSITAKKSQLTCCSCFKVEAVSSPLATARILAAREAPLAGAGGRCPLETILIESFLLLSSD